MSHLIYVDRLPEQVMPGRRLGRHVVHDSRSLQYLHQPRDGEVPQTMLWLRHIPILDQGDVGSCTGNALVGAVGTSPVDDALPATHPALDENEALRIYSEAEVIDGDGPYPPNDYGSSGLSVCKAAQHDGLISGYTWATSVTGMVSALQNGPVLIGINWYDSFDSPAGDGTIAISAGAQVRGGHELVLRGVDVTARRFKGDNSWGDGWGDHGSFQLTWDTMTRLLDEQGDCAVPLPLTAPVPVPTPTPTPAPGPADPVDQAYAEDQRLIDWSRRRHCGANKYAAQQYAAWRQAKGY
jgi:hypothetical protein